MEISGGESTDETAVIESEKMLLLHVKTFSIRCLSEHCGAQNSKKVKAKYIAQYGEESNSKVF